MGISVFPHAVEASVMSFVSDLLTSDKITATNTAALNSQNMPLLEAPLNSNAIDSNGGGDIIIVDDDSLSPETGPIPGNELNNHGSDQISIYVVRKGDTLSDIAKLFDVSKNTIIWGNDIKGGIITEGQTLAILPVSGVKHIVKSGDTLKSIAAKYSANIDDVLQYNNLPIDSKLAVGDEIIVPDGEVADVPTPVASPGTKSTPVSQNAHIRALQQSRKQMIANYPSYDSYYIRPITGGVKTQGIHGYNGVDLASSIGTPVMASASGDVIISKSSGWNGGYGQYIVIQHGNNTQTLYGHLSRNIVSEGAHVVQGQVIGYMGSTGNSTGPHVHFEIRGAKNPF